MKRWIFIIFVFVSFSIFSYGQEKMKVTLEDCLKIGLDNNKTIKISNSKMNQSRAKLSESEAAQYPSLKVTGAYTRLSEVEPFTVNFQGREMTISPIILDQYQLRFSLFQPVFSGFRLANTSELSRYNLLAAEEDLMKDNRQLILDIKNSFWTLHNALESIKIIDENLELLKSHFRNIENMHKSGMATLNEVLKVKVQISNMEVNKIDVENASKTAMMVLNNILGMNTANELEIIVNLSFGERLIPGQNELLEKAKNNRSDLKSMEYRVKSAESALGISKSGYYPQINFAANYNYMRPNSRIMPSKDEFIGTWDLGITMSYDIWNWGIYSDQAEQAECQLEQSRFALEQLKDAIALEVYQSYKLLNKYIEKITVCQEAINQAEENYRVTNEKFKTGLAISSELLDAENLLLISKINKATSVAEYEIALAKLEKAIGNELSKE